MRKIAVLLCLALAGCVASEKPTANLNVANAIPNVPADIKANIQRRVPKPAETELSQQRTYRLIQALKASEEEKIAYGLRLIQIIDNSKLLLSNPATTKELTKQLEQTRSNTAKLTAAKP